MDLHYWFSDLEVFWENQWNFQILTPKCFDSKIKYPNSFFSQIYLYHIVISIMHACSFYSLQVKMNGMDIHRVQFRQDVHQFSFICDLLYTCIISFVSRKKTFIWIMYHLYRVKKLLYESCIICIEKKILLYESCIICIKKKDIYMNHVSFVSRKKYFIWIMYHLLMLMYMI